MSKILVSAAAAATLFVLAPVPRAEADVLKYSFSGELTSVASMPDGAFAVFGSQTIGDPMQIDIVVDTMAPPTIVGSTAWNFAAQSATITIGATSVDFASPSGPLQFQDAFPTEQINWGNLSNGPLLFGPRLVDSSGTAFDSIGLTAGNWPSSINLSDFASRSMRFLDSFTGGGYLASIDSLTVTVVPAPGAAALLAMGGIVAARRRR